MRMLSVAVDLQMANASGRKHGNRKRKIFFSQGVSGDSISVDDRWLCSSDEVESKSKIKAKGELKLSGPGREDNSKRK